MGRGSRIDSGRPVRVRRWGAAALALGLSGAAMVLVAPASAGAATTNAQLSLSGMATKANVLGGERIGIHPGDTVNFTASSAPTAGLDNIPALGSVLKSVLGIATSDYQVVVSFPAGFPSVGGKTIVLGKGGSGCPAAQAALAVRFPTKKTYNFTWTVRYVSPGLLGGCKVNGLNDTDMNALKQAGVAVNAKNQWQGTIEVAPNARDGGIGVQLPGVSAAPSAPVVGQLPTVGLPGVSAEVPVSVPSIISKAPSLPGVPGGGTKSAPSGGSSGSGGGLSGPGLTIPQRVMAGADSVGGSGSPAGFTGAGSDSGGLGSAAQASGGTSYGSGAQADKPAPSPASKQGRAADLASRSKLAGAQVPVLLAIVAIVALSLVTAAYARMHLLKRGA